MRSLAQWKIAKGCECPGASQPGNLLDPLPRCAICGTRWRFFLLLPKGTEFPRPVKTCDWDAPLPGTARPTNERNQ